MAKNLIIVESPTKTKTIGKILGSNYKVLASKGHLRDLPKSRMGVDIENDFEPDYINVRGKALTINALRDAAKAADKVYLATDPDREGEAISWHLSTLLGLNLDEENRIAFNEITKDGVKEGIKNPKKIDMQLVNSQQARRVMDRIVGYQISPILWKKVKGGLSAGRVQSVALKIICDREREIEAFVKEEYWTVHATHKKDDVSFTTDYFGAMQGEKKVKAKLDTEEDAQMIVSRLSKEYTVTSVEEKRKSRKPFAPFTTSTLQQEASKRLGFSTSKTMTVAQQLYEGISLGAEGEVGLITYMRTDSTRLSQQFVSEAIQYIQKEYGEEYATKGVSYSGKKSGSQDAHEAVRPSYIQRTPKSIRSHLSNDQFRLYELIWQRALASQMKSFTYLSTAVELLNGVDIFRVNGMKPVFEGFQVVWETKNESVLLPSLVVGDVLTAKKVEKKQHFTQPPARYTEASLVQVLEKNGIGRPSTYASTIKSILSRNYVKIEKKQFHPTPLGFTVIDLLSENFSDIIDESFTAKMEDQLDLVADGKVEWKQLMRDFYGVLEKDLERAKKDETSYKLPDVKVGESCPKCGKDLIIKHGRHGDFIGCSGFPSCDFTKNIVKSTGVICPKCGGNIVEKISKRGKVFYACDNYPKCDYASWDKPTGEVCDKCGDLMVHRKNRKENRVLCHNEACETNR